MASKKTVSKGKKAPSLEEKELETQSQIEMLSRHFVPSPENLYAIAVDEWIAAHDKPVTDNNINDTVIYSPKVIKDYLYHCIVVERDIISLRERLIDLKEQKDKCTDTVAIHKKNIKEKMRSQIDRAARREKTALEKWDLEERSSWPSPPIFKCEQPSPSFTLPGDEPTRPNVNKPVCPEAPIAPTFEVPGLFNKKKVAKANEAKQTEYERQCYRYNLAYTSFLNEMGKYDSALQKYKEDMEEYRKRVELYTLKKAEYEEQLAHYLHDKANYEKLYAEWESDYHNRDTELSIIVDKKNAEIKSRAAELKKQVTQFKPHPQEEGALSVIRKDIRETEKQLNSFLSARAKLYSAGILYKKYRDFVAISSFFEYFESGRCDALDGPFGAYNLYESEIRANRVISTLSTILESLKQVQMNQYMVFSQLTSAGSELTTLNRSMEKMIGSLQAIDAKAEKGNQLMEMLNTTEIVVALEEAAENTSEIAANTKSISRNTDHMVDSVDHISRNTDAILTNSFAIAYNTQANAYYSKRNAELTDALGFLLALK